jgi:tRNA (guanine-N7-)-methyltransferase
MPRRKLQKFKEIGESGWYKDMQSNPEVINTTEWFGNSNPIVLELGAGYGEYAVGLAEKNSDINYIAVDIKSDRLWMGLQWAQEKGLNNVRFLRANIYRIDELFKEKSISDIWLTFSDPQPHKPRKRLTHQNYLEKYYKIQRDNSRVFVKTDSDLLYESTLESVKNQKKYTLITATREPTVEQTRDIITRYERKFEDLGHSIKYIELKK